jgi:hypothetical protein
MPIACSTTSVLTGQDGSLWFAQPGVSLCVEPSDFQGRGIYVGADSTFAVGDVVTFTPENGAVLPEASPPLVAGQPYYVVAVDDPAPGYISVSETPGGVPVAFPIANVPYVNSVADCVPMTGGDYDNSDITNGVDSLCTDAPTYDSPAFDPGTAEYDNADAIPRWLFDVPLTTNPIVPGGHIRITESPEVVCDVREFSAEIQRETLDSTPLPCTFGTSRKHAKFRRTQSGFAGLTGSATLYFTDDDDSAARKMLRAVMERQQYGARLKLYVNTVADSSGLVDDSASQLVEFPCALTNMSVSVTPDDITTAEVSFVATGRPTGFQ